MPSIAENADGIAADFIFAFFVFKPTARQAALCAKFAADAIGIQVFIPLWPASIPASITLYI